MEAAPRLPMISFELWSSTENVQFGKKLKPYIASFYNEDPEGYIAEISKLDNLRAHATHPHHDVTGLETLKKYYCQLHFLKSRFPMDPSHPCFIEFEWKDQICTASGGIHFELMAVLHNIGSLHTILGAQDSRTNPEGMKSACAHFQCAVWAFQSLKETFSDALGYMTSLNIPHFYKQVCLAQAQECILEKSMLDNRKSTIISKVAVQVWDYYRQALASLRGISEDVVGRNKYKDWMKYLQFKIAYHRCISLLFQGQQAEELQKMGERLAFYQAACDSLQEASKYLTNKQQKELADALAFTTDVVEGKKKAAKNENEYIYHEEVPDLSNLQEVKGASLVKGIEFNINDPEVAGPDIFQRLIPMEAHEAASVYSEKKAEVLRNMGQRLESKDQTLVEFMSSMQLDLLTKMHQATGIPQELIDRAASLSAKPTAIQDLIDSMARLSNIYHDVEANLNEIELLLKEEEENEKSYQEVMGKRPASIITTDLAREASKYKEAHSKAKESNETLHKAMMTHLENLKILQKPIKELQQRLPSVELPDTNIDQNVLKELDHLNSKVDEMKTQRATLWAQLRDAIHNDDITSALVTRQPNQSLEDVFRNQLQKHSNLIDILDQNLAAQDNIKKAFIECYAKAVSTRRYIQDLIQKRNSTIQALIASHDSYDDLLAKAMKGIEFYTKLEVNVSKLMQRIKSASKVQQEEREQMMSKNMQKKEEISSPVGSSVASAPKLKDYLEARKKAGTYPTNYSNISDTQSWPPSVRPAPLGSEITTDPATARLSNEAAVAAVYYQQQQTYQQQFNLQNKDLKAADDVSHLTARMSNLLARQQPTPTSYPYTSYTPQNYTPTSYSYQPEFYGNTEVAQSPAVTQDSSKASTATTNSYHRTIPSFMPQNQDDQVANMQYTDAYNQTNTQQYLGQYQQPTQQTKQEYYQYGQQYTQNQPTGVQSAAVYQPEMNYPANYLQQPYANQAVPTLRSEAANLTSTTATYGTAAQVSNLNAVNTQTGLVHGTVQDNQGSQPAADQQQQSFVGQTPGTTAENTGLQYYRQSPLPNVPDSYNQYDASKYLSQPQQSLGTQQYFPQGYAPNYVNPVNVSSENTYGMTSYHQQYYTQQHATSVAGNIGAYDNYSTYTSPTGDPYKVQFGSNNPYMSSSAFSTPSSTSDGLPATTATYTGNTNNTYGSVYGYAPAAVSNPTNYPQPAVNPVSNIQAKESNVDLLTGLDFSATSNMPTLIPQPNKVPDIPKETEQKISVVEIKPPKPSTAKDADEAPKKEVIRVLPSKPLNNQEVKDLFSRELEKYEKYVETLTIKTLSGPTTLDVKWKEIQDSQELDAQKRIISVARCYPMKNRFPDILPYDYSRVELKSTKDDYINASFIKQISPYNPQFIVTQAPLQSTVGEFWAMVREQHVELICCLLNDSEIEDVYWPKEKGQTVTILNQNLVINLQSIVVKPNWTERLICLTIPDKKESWIVIHLQFTSWPGSLFPTSPEPFVSFTIELISLFQQQKSTAHPILLHCASGIGRSGLLCLLVNAILDVANQPSSMPDLTVQAVKLGNFRKNILRDREHLKFAYEAMLFYMRQMLSSERAKKKLNEVSPVKEEIKEDVSNDVQSKPIDPLSTLDPFWASKKL